MNIDGNSYILIYILIIINYYLIMSCAFYFRNAYQCAWTDTWTRGILSHGRTARDSNVNAVEFRIQEASKQRNCSVN